MVNHGLDLGFHAVSQAVHWVVEASDEELDGKDVTPTLAFLVKEASMSANVQVRLGRALLSSMPSFEGRGGGEQPICIREKYTALSFPDWGVIIHSRHLPGPTVCPCCLKVPVHSVEKPTRTGTNVVHPLPNPSSVKQHFLCPLSDDSGFLKERSQVLFRGICYNSETA